MGCIQICRGGGVEWDVYRSVQMEVASGMYTDLYRWRCRVGCIQICTGGGVELDVYRSVEVEV